MRERTDRNGHGPLKDPGGPGKTLVDVPDPHPAGPCGSGSPPGAWGL
ncbi:hypothetical protein SGL43_00410 [Streptomyces globisporus]|uniref:Uncharacterized protein n=1 Tax=Streptomyces globisporus TaxID=1908 RepID=A0ABM9GPV9_STRGL|nr:hypothetical protein SGL43_00410 [Streptomyces globisporus]